MTKYVEPKIKVSDEDYQFLDDQKIDAKQLAEKAFTEWLDWLNGNKRHSTISDLEVERLYEMFLTNQESITENHLIRDLKFPVGRVRFLISAVRKKYPKVLGPEIEKIRILVNDPTKTPVDDHYFRFRILEDFVYVFRDMAKSNGWSVEKLSLERQGLGQFNVRVLESLRDDLLVELKKYE